MILKEETYDNLYKGVKGYIDNNCIMKDPEGKLRLLSKCRSYYYSWMFYLSKAVYDAKINRAISLMALHKLNEEIGHLNFQVAGLESGAPPLALGMSLVSHDIGHNVRSFSIRKTPKEYGLQNHIEGAYTKDRPVVLVDVLCNSSKSLEQSRVICEQHGLEVMKTCFVIVNKVNEIHDDFRKEHDMYLPKDFKVVYLYDLDDFNLSNPSH